MESGTLWGPHAYICLQCFIVFFQTICFVSMITINITSIQMTTQKMRLSSWPQQAIDMIGSEAQKKALSWRRWTWIKKVLKIPRICPLVDEWSHGKSPWSHRKIMVNHWTMSGRWEFQFANCWSTRDQGVFQVSFSQSRWWSSKQPLMAGADSMLNGWCKIRTRWHWWRCYGGWKHMKTQVSPNMAGVTCF